MKSPYTGKEMPLLKEQDILTYRGKEYHYISHCYKCIDTNETFTTEELDEINIGQIYNQYRRENGIPFPDELITLRENFGLSYTDMSAILGIGINQYRLYENGDMPNVSVGRALRSIIDNPMLIMSYIESAKQELGNKYDKVLQKVKSNIVIPDHELITWIFGNYPRSEYNGYAPQDIDTLKNVLVYIIHKIGNTLVTKMNKLLFYIDMLSYKSYGVGITGLSYTAQQYGATPLRWDRVFSSIEGVYQEPKPLQDGRDIMVIDTELQYDSTALTSKQLSVIDKVIEIFGNLSSAEISDKCHDEKGWIENVETHSSISYQYAFDLKHV